MQTMNINIDVDKVVDELGKEYESLIKDRELLNRRFEVVQTDLSILLSLQRSIETKKSSSSEGDR